MTCEYCADQDGEALVPYYGVAPHICFYKIPGAVIGESQVLPKDQWPDNFKPDPENPACGTYWCTHCGEGKPEDVSP